MEMEMEMQMVTEALVCNNLPNVVIQSTAQRPEFDRKSSTPITRPSSHA